MSDKRHVAVKQVRFCYGHRVANHLSKCRNVHGHEALVEVGVEGPLVSDSQASDRGMVMDFAEIKRAIYELIEEPFDHVMIIDKEDWRLKDVLGLTRTSFMKSRYQIDGFGWIQEIDGAPTAENLARLCFDLLSARLNHDQIWVKFVRFWETNSCYAEYARFGGSPQVLSQEVRAGDFVR